MRVDLARAGRVRTLWPATPPPPRTKNNQNHHNYGLAEVYLKGYSDNWLIDWLIVKLLYGTYQHRKAVIAKKLC